MQNTNQTEPIITVKPSLLTSETFWFFSLLSVLLLNHVVVYFMYNLQYIDTDQPYIWQGAVDYAAGRVYEPRFYGQNYNTFMEGLFAVPFLKQGMPVYKAVPLATHIIFLTPFLFSAFYLFFTNRKVQGVLVLCLLLCMNPAYDLLNSLPRGFVTGLFFCTFYIVSLHHPKNALLVFFNLVMALVGYYVNPNSLIVSVPFAFYLFLHGYRNLSFYMASALALTAIWPLHQFFDVFYLQHPDYIKSGIELEYSMRYLFENLSNLDARFAHITPLHARRSLDLIFLLLIFALCFHFKRFKKELLMFFVFLTFLLLCFTLGKTADGSTWVYYSYSRMYLGIPLFMVLCLALLPARSSHLIKFIFVFSLFFGLNKIFTMKKDLKWHFNDNNWVALFLIPVDTALDGVSFYGKKCTEYNEDFFLIAHGFWMNTVLAYGGPAVDKTFPVTFETKWDKRYWIKEKYLPSVIAHFMLLSSTYDIADKLQGQPGFEVEKIDGYGLVRIKNNTLTMEEFIPLVRAHEYAY